MQMQMFRIFLLFKLCNIADNCSCLFLDINMKLLLISVLLFMAYASNAFSLEDSKDVQIRLSREAKKTGIKGKVAKKKKTKAKKAKKNKAKAKKGKAKKAKKNKKKLRERFV